MCYVLVKLGLTYVIPVLWSILVKYSSFIPCVFTVCTAHKSSKVHIYFKIDTLG